MQRTTAKIRMSGQEFLQKLLEGEREFREVSVEPYFNLSGNEQFAALQEQLRAAELEDSPIILERADLTGIDADGLHMPFVKANGACFKHATLMEANLESSEFENADFRYAKLSQTNMKTCHLRDADLRQSDLNLAELNRSLLSGANMAGANLLFTNLQAADIKEIVNLQLARSVKTANFQFVSLGELEKTIIRMEMWGQQGKKRRLFGGAG